jgi:mono/diheme cytochrome c family protein
MLMRTPPVLPTFVLTISIAGAALVTADDATRGGQARQSGAKSANESVAPVAGPSWLNRLNIKYEDTNLGRGAGRYGPSPSESPAATPGSKPFVAGKPVQLTGADLYRLNCQACHRAEGTGAPPEVKSVFDLVQGSSIESIRQQLQKEGKTAGAAAIRKQAAQARSDLYRRIREGGQRMPPLAHLQEADIDALYAYLTELAHAQKPAQPSQRTASWVRLGEHVVKGTCHICHDAVGPRPTSEAMLQGAIPSFAVLVADNPQVTFISKARSGAPLIGGRPSFHYRGRMPVFFYLQDAELAAAYDFLVKYPPQATTKQH